MGKTASHMKYAVKRAAEKVPPPLPPTDPYVLIDSANQHICCSNNIIHRFTRCANLNTIIKMLRTELHTITFCLRVN